MSILINKDLLWVSVPRCASVSIEKTLMNDKNIQAEHYFKYDELIIKNKENINIPFHFHAPLSNLYEHFGKKESICITRDWVERWLSSFEHMFICIKRDNFNSIIDWEDVDNNFIYDAFNEEFSNNLYSMSHEGSAACYSKLVKEDIDVILDKSVYYRSMLILCSQKYWKDNEKCTYEFDISEMYKFENFISDRYNMDFKIPHINRGSGIKSKIIIDDKLKNHLWNIFEKPYESRKRLL